MLKTIFINELPQKIPGWELRESQIEMAELISTIMAERHYALLEAGTGTGKTLAYLVPLFRHVTGRETKAIICTATIALQDQLWHKDIPLVRQALEVNPKIALAKGRSNYLCLYRLAEELAAKTTADRELIALQQWSARTKTGDASQLPPGTEHVFPSVCAREICPRNSCPYQKQCFFLQARNKIRQSEIIIANYHLLFSDLLLKAESGDSAILPAVETMIFDEAHRFPEIATSCFSLSVSYPRLAALLKEAAQAAPKKAPFRKLVSEIESRAALFFFSFPQSGEPFRLTAYPNDLAHEIRALLKHLIQELAGTAAEDATREERLVLTTQQLSKFLFQLNFVLEPDNDYVSWGEVVQNNHNAYVQLYSSPLDVSPLIRQLLFDGLPAALFVSATLTTRKSDFSYFRHRLGLSKVLEKVFPTPFRYHEQCLLYIPTELPPPGSPDYYAHAAELMSKLITMARGRTLALFTSHRALNECFERCRPKLGEFRLLKQGERPRFTLLAEFSQDIHSVLFATSSFWEGIDVPGESLSCLIIDRLPFPVPNHPLVVARAEALKQSGKNPFFSEALPQAILRLKQGFGRLIRTQTDRGVVAIFDRRILERPYGRYFLEALPSCPVVHTLEEAGDFLSRALRS